MGVHTAHDDIFPLALFAALSRRHAADYGRCRLCSGYLSGHGAGEEEERLGGEGTRAGRGG